MTEEDKDKISAFIGYMIRGGCPPFLASEDAEIAEFIARKPWALEAVLRRAIDLRTDHPVVKFFAWLENRASWACMSNEEWAAATLANEALARLNGDEELAEKIRADGVGAPERSSDLCSKCGAPFGYQVDAPAGVPTWSCSRCGATFLARAASPPDGTAPPSVRRLVAEMRKVDGYDYGIASNEAKSAAGLRIARGAVLLEAVSRDSELFAAVCFRRAEHEQSCAPASPATPPTVPGEPDPRRRRQPCSQRLHDGRTCGDRALGCVVLPGDGASADWARPRCRAHLPSVAHELLAFDDDASATAPERPHKLTWNGTDDKGTHGGAPHVHRCKDHEKP